MRSRDERDDSNLIQIKNKTSSEIKGPCKIKKLVTICIKMLVKLNIYRSTILYPKTRIRS